MRLAAPVLACIPFAACSTPALDSEAPPAVVLPTPVVEPAQPAFQASALVFADSDSEPFTLADLIRRYRVVTGWEIEVDEDWREQLGAERVFFGRSVTVPRENVHSFVEAILNQHGFVLIRPLTRWIKVSEPPDCRLLVTVPRVDDTAWLRSVCLPVPIKRIGDMSDRAALLVATVVELPGMDVVQLSEWLRPTLRSIVTEDVVAIEDVSSLLVLGTGQRVARRVEMLRALQAMNARAAGGGFL